MLSRILSRTVSDTITDNSNALSRAVERFLLRLGSTFVLSDERDNQARDEGIDQRRAVGTEKCDDPRFHSAVL